MRRRKLPESQQFRRKAAKAPASRAQERPDRREAAYAAHGATLTYDERVARAVRVAQCLAAISGGLAGLEAEGAYPPEAGDPGALSVLLEAPGEESRPDHRARAYLGAAGVRRYLEGVLAGRPEGLVAAAAACVSPVVRYRTLVGRPRCTRCCGRPEKFDPNAGPRSRCFAGQVEGENQYTVCGGGCAAELTLSVVTAQIALSQVGALLPWAPLLLAAARADPGSAFAGLPAELAASIVSALLEARCPLTSVPPWLWKPAC